MFDRKIGPLEDLRDAVKKVVAPVDAQPRRRTVGAIAGAKNAHNRKHR